MSRKEAIFELRHHQVSLEKVVCAKDFVNALGMAIEALSIEPCKDCISRQAVLDTLDTADKFLDEDRAVERYKAILAEAYDVLPSVTPQEPKTGWIPVSERLPSDDEEVIVSILDDSGDTSFSYTTSGWHHKGIWIVDNSICPMVKAWMSLPEPFKESEE